MQPLHLRDLVPSAVHVLGTELDIELPLVYGDDNLPSGKIKLFLTVFRNETGVHTELMIARKKIDLMIGILTGLSDKLSAHASENRAEHKED